CSLLSRTPRVLQEDRDCEGFHKVGPKKTQRSAGLCEQCHISLLPGDVKFNSSRAKRPSRRCRSLDSGSKILSNLIVGGKSLASTSKRFSPGGSCRSARGGCERTCVEARSWEPQDLDITRSSGRRRA